MMSEGTGPWGVSRDEVQEVIGDCRVFGFTLSDVKPLLSFEWRKDPPRLRL